MNHDFREQFAAAYGPKYEEDICRGPEPAPPLGTQSGSFCHDPEPAPPLGMQSGSLGALDHDLPQATVNFEGARARGNTP